MSWGHPKKTWHKILDDRSLEMDRVIAEKIRANPKLVQVALTIIERWLANPDYSESNRQAVLEWKRIIENSSLEALLTLLESSPEEAQRLRQSSPFCGDGHKSTSKNWGSSAQLTFLIDPLLRA